MSATRTFRHFLLTAATGFLATFSPAAANAQTLFYNGDWDGYSGVTSSRGTVPSQTSMLYESFLTGGSGWSITGLFANFLVYYNRPWSAIEFEIRTGMADGDPGTLLFGGQGPVTSWAATGRYCCFFGDGSRLDEYRAELSGLSISLSPGEYWLGLRVVDSYSLPAFLVTTSGQNAFAADLDGTGIWDAPGAGLDYWQVPPWNDGTSHDFSMGALGTSAEALDVVPEPTSFALLALGLGALSAKSHRRKKS